ncbi:MAG: ArsR family transcriptional regulator [Bacteroidota bacterium]
MLETLISSKTRIKLLLKFFLNSNTTSYLRHLEGEFGESTNAIRVELNKLEGAGMLVSRQQGNKKFFRANTQHPLFSEIHSIILKYVGIDKIIDKVVKRLGDVEQVFLVGKFSKGLDSDIIDLMFIGNIDKIYLINLIDKVEGMIHRKVRYVIYTESEFKSLDLSHYDPAPLLLWDARA